MRLTDVPPGLSERQATRKRWYFAIMGFCLLLILLAWNVVRLYSTTAAVVMSAAAAVLPPIAAVVANWHGDSLSVSAPIRHWGPVPRRHLLHRGLEAPQAAIRRRS